VVLSSGEEQPEGRGRTGLVVSIVVVVVLGGAAAFWYVKREAPTPSTAPAPRATPAPTPRAVAPAPAGTGTVEITSGIGGALVSVDGERLGPAPQRVELSAGPHKVRVEKEGFEAYEREVHVVPGRTLALEASLAAPAPRLSVTTDVPGAQVFLDRKFVGEAPLVIRDLEPGRHRLNVSAEGHEGYSEDIQIASGLNAVEVRFKEVRLDESLAVKHKHGIGSCQGHLVATTEGLSYETDNEKDRFFVPFEALEPLEVDYLKRNLRLKVRGGRTYNFTADDADDLLVFQRAVEKARGRLP